MFPSPGMLLFFQEQNHIVANSARNVQSLSRNGNPSPMQRVDAVVRRTLVIDQDRERRAHGAHVVRFLVVFVGAIVVAAEDETGAGIDRVPRFSALGFLD
jgi:hypothetical protein